MAIRNWKIFRPRDWPKSVKIGLPVIIGLLIVVVLVGLYLKNRKDMVGGFEVGVVHEFRYTFRSDVKTDYGWVDGRTFVLPSGRTFSPPRVGPRNEVFFVKDPTMPVNRFKIVRRTEPAVRVGGAIFQAAHGYVEVLYNSDDFSEQKFVPRLEPTNH